MTEIKKITKIENKKRIALLDTSSISFMEGLQMKGIRVEYILEDYDLILIPEWVLAEIGDAKGRMEYVQKLAEYGYPICRIAEEDYSSLANGEEGNLYHIVLASVYRIGRIRSYLRRFVEKSDSLDMDAYKDWINRLYDEWPIPGEMLSSGRVRKKNAGEISITILAEVVSWYCLDARALTVYSQDSDTYELQRRAEARLRDFFISRTPVSVSYKSNDAILCQLFRDGRMSPERISQCRKDLRRITYSREREDHSVILVTELVDNDLFLTLIQDRAVHIIF